MMARRMKRSLSLLLALVMCLSLVNISAFAAGYEDQVMDGYFVVGSDGVTETTENATNSDQGYTVSKTIKQTGENAFDITLKVETQQTVQTNDAAVMIIIDTSNSMDYCAECGQENSHTDDCPNYSWKNNRVTSAQSRMQAVKDALTGTNGFIDSLLSGNEGGGKIYVSVVKFGSNASTVCDWIDITSGTGNQNGAARVKEAINKLSADGGTNLDAGLTLAYNRLGMSDVSSASNKYTVLLTDGEPTYYYYGNSTSTDKIEGSRGGGGSSASEDTVDHAIDAANNVKSRSTLYTICFGVEDDVCLEGQTIHVCAYCEESRDKHVKVELCANCGQPKSDHPRGDWGIRWCPTGWNSWDAETYYYCDETRETQYKDKTVTNGELTVGSFLSGSIATSSDHAYNAKNTAALNEAFKDIADSASEGNTGAGTQVIDPMGEYITFGQVKSVTGGTAKFENNTLTWTLDPEDAQTSSKDGTTTYTFTLTYSITLDTAAEGFQETEKVDGEDVTKYYPTNGYTRLDLPGEDTKDVVFNVPGVCGKVPTVGYTINYLYKDRQSGQYVTGKTETGSAKLWDTITINSNSYTKQYYSFKEGPTGTQTLTQDNMVFNLYYDPIAVNVQVNHYLVTTTKTDGGETVTGPVLQKTDSYSNYYQGDTFSVPEEDMLAYTVVSSVEGEDGTTYTTDAYQNVTLTDTGTKVINIYYLTESDARTDVDYEIHYFYREDQWLVNEDTGRYELVTGTYQENEANKVTGTAKHGETVNVPDKAEGYTFDHVDGTVNNAMTLTLNKDGSNVVNVYYVKTPENPSAETATLTIVHKYYEETINGRVEVETERRTEKDNESVYVGETWAATPDTKNGGYTLETLAQDFTVTITEADKHYEIIVTYVKDVRVPVDVVINHYYTTYTWTVDPETGAGEYVVTNESSLKGIHATGTWYAGQTYKPTQIPNGYTYVSGGDAAVLELGTNTFDLYYETKIGSEADEADITVTHHYVTYTSYVDENGIVHNNEATEETVTDDTYYGIIGETFEAQMAEKDDFKFVSADTEDLKTVLVGPNGEYNIYYEKYDNQLGELVPVVVEPIYKTYTLTIDPVTGETVKNLTNTEGEGSATALGNYYAGQNAVAVVSDYYKDGFTYDAADEQNTPNQTVKVSADESQNVITIVYSKTVDGRGEPRTVLVNNVYTTVTKTLKDGQVVSEESSFTSANTTYSNYYVGQTFVTTGKGTSLGFAEDTREGVTQPAAEIAITETSPEVIQVTFYWYQEIDQTIPATVKVIHHYTLHDSNPNVGDRSWTVGEDEQSIAAAAGQVYPIPYDYQSNAFDAEDVTDVWFNGDSTAERVSVTLNAGSNLIDVFYEAWTDSRAASSVKVIHNYYHDAEAMAAGTTEGSYEENISEIDGKLIMEADSYTATLRTVNNDLSYAFNSADPEGYTITVSADAEQNVITINYIRAEATYTVVHEYYTNGSLTGTVTSDPVAGKMGDVVNAADIAKVTTYEGNTYTYTSADKESMTLTAVVEDNVITLRYDRTTGGGGDYIPPTPTPDPDPTDPVDPPTEIEDEDPPLSDLPDDEGEIDISDENPPLSDLPEETIDDEETPMADAPETGDNLWLWITTASLSGLGLIALGVNQITTGRKKKETESK